MAQPSTPDIDQLTTVVQGAVARLSAREIRALASHPDAVLGALAAAAKLIHDSADVESGVIETIGSTATVGRVATSEARRRLDQRSHAGAGDVLLRSDEFAARSGLRTRQSVHDWLHKGRIIGWSGAKRGYVFPAAQLDERNRPLAGLERIRPLFPDGYAAWVWLTTPLAALDGATPLSRLKLSEIDRVVAAAQGDAQGDFA